MKTYQMLGFVTTTALLPTAQAATLLSENFDSLTSAFGPFVSAGEGNGDGTDWTEQLPNGWSQTYGPGHEEGGPTEFDGWRAMDPASWVATASDQGRANFTAGEGAILVADSDEYDDLASAAFESTLQLPPVDLATVSVPQSLYLSFDSSWQAEPQIGQVKVTYQGEGAEFPVTYTVLDWNGDNKSTAFSEALTLALNNPAGATSATVEFYHKGNNNWWWAIDNVEIFNADVVITQQPAGGTYYAGSNITLAGLETQGGVASYQWYRIEGEERTIIAGATQQELALSNSQPGDSGLYAVEVTSGDTTTSSSPVAVDILPVEPTTVYFMENFDSVALGFPVQEGSLTGAGPFVDKVWSATAPSGWTVDRSGVNGVGNAEVGVEEWEGWNFADPAWWSSTAGNQNRAQFTRSACVAAIVDPDEWDDLGGASQGEASKASLPENPPLFATVVNYDSEMTSPPIDISGATAGTLQLRFSSSWRPEDSQMAIIWVSFDGGERERLLHWNSFSGDTVDEGDGIFHPDAENESVLLAIPNPAGASSMELTFHMPQADNDWWWAVDNLLVFSGSEPADVLVAPQSHTVLAGGGAVVFEAQADGIGTFTYDWTGPGGAPVGSDNIDDPVNRLTIAEPGTDDVGDYAVTISNPAGGIELCASLQILPALFAQQPADKVGDNAVVEGLDAFLDVNVHSYDPELSYQWYKFVDHDNNPATPEIKEAIAGANNGAGNNPDRAFTLQQLNNETGLYETQMTLAYFEAELESVTGRYCLEVTNQYGSVSSRTATLSVVPMVFSLQPVSTLVQAGEPVTLQAQADSAFPVTYQWYRREVGSPTRELLEGETGAQLSFPASGASQNAFYSVEARSDNGQGSIGVLFSEEALVTVYVDHSPVVLFSEDFESLPLGDSVDDSPAASGVWTQTPPSGWVADNSGVPGFGTENDGITEWAGWSFADRLWWASVDDQQRSDFTNASGTVMVADPDEWDDAAHAAGSYNTYLTTPAISLAGAEEGSLVLSFDSSWRPEVNQRGQTELSFDGGATWLPFLIFESDANDPEYKDHATNEHVSLPVNAPSGASEMLVRFSLVDAGNNWWWALDNIAVTAEVPGGILAITDYTISAGAVTLTWTSASTVAYKLTWSPDLVEWTDVPGYENIVGEEGSTTRSVNFTELLTQAPPKAFIRVERR
ncbi:immunoglobulin domain-containing protein [Roseibacillus ishigakijimensis]|uniref:Immunoglobulin domain-containing protein n=1 Tax=Roseibacillus ishigakijimensis TaxID=454146 RepID=A0A934VN44_9BACT|nr:immunoglobulin domain-containing protein [Roseibacillus ishigakijimensis]MBK1834635.1 immunoglobulin domain-containing protein [Roseibacillus ishigakijimensis]